MTSNDARASGIDDKEINLFELLRVIWSGKVWIAALVVVAFGMGAISVLKTEPLYEAEGLLQLEAKSGALSLPSGMQDLLGSNYYTGNSPGETEMEILKSRMVMGQVVEDLNLEVYAYPRPMPILGLIPKRLRLPDFGVGFLKAFQWGNEAIEIGELEVPQSWLGKAFTLTITGEDSYRLTLPDGSSQEGLARKRQSLADRGFSLVVDRLEGPIGREFLLGRMDLASAISILQGGFSVAEVPRYSSILQVAYIDANPRRAERILNAISQAYVDQNISHSAAEAQNSLSFIEEQLPVAAQAVADAQRALNAYRQQQKSVDVEYETRSLLERATQIEKELSALALQEEEVKNRYTINHPTYQALLQTRAGLEDQLAQTRSETSDLPETQKEIFNLSRDLEVNQQVYVQLLNRSQELRVVRASTVGSVRIIDTAYSNGARISPRISRTLAVHILLGMISGVGIVLLRRAMRRGIRGAQEIEHAGIPVFATVNFSPDAANIRKVKGTLPILALTKPEDLVIEALRSLRTSLHFGMLDAKTNTVLLTSAAPGAGKSFTAVNLAAVAAQAGQKVCLIDADLRKGYLRRFFGKEKDTPGLAEYLARGKTLDEVLLQGPIDTFSFISTGRFPPNPSELLMRAEFQELLTALNEQFDLVIIDSPPALAVTDPVVMGSFTGATIIVARYMETMLGEIEAVRRAFEMAGVKVAGAILNGYKPSEESRYGGQYHSYNYRYSYKSEKS